MHLTHLAFSLGKTHEPDLVNSPFLNPIFLLGLYAIMSEIFSLFFFLAFLVKSLSYELIFCSILTISGATSCYSWRNDTNVILADEMGLGKTVQSVSMLGFLQVEICLYSYYSCMYNVFSNFKGELGHEVMFKIL